MGKKKIHRRTLQVFNYTCAKWESIALSSFADKGKTMSHARQTQISPPQREIKLEEVKDHEQEQEMLEACAVIIQYLRTGCNQHHKRSSAAEDKNILAATL